MHLYMHTMLLGVLLILCPFSIILALDSLLFIGLMTFLAVGPYKQYSNTLKKCFVTPWCPCHSCTGGYDFQARVAHMFHSWVWLMNAFPFVSFQRCAQSLPALWKLARIDGASKSIAVWVFHNLLLKFVMSSALRSYSLSPS